MAENTSATGGIINSEILPLSKPEIEDLLYPIIAGLTKLGETELFIAYQFVAPAAPNMEVNWAAYFVRPFGASNLPQICHDSRGDGSDVLVEELSWELRVSFFGPASVQKAYELRAGLFIEQNRCDTLLPHQLAIRYIGTPLFLPWIANTKWLHRTDLEVRLTQIAKYRYPVRNILSGIGHTRDDTNLSISFDSNNARIKE